MPLDDIPNLKERSAVSSSPFLTKPISCDPVGKSKTSTPPTSKLHGASNSIATSTTNPVARLIRKNESQSQVGDIAKSAEFAYPSTSTAPSNSSYVKNSPFLQGSENMKRSQSLRKPVQKVVNPEIPVARFDPIKEPTSKPETKNSSQSSESKQQKLNTLGRSISAFSISGRDGTTSSASESNPSISKLDILRRFDSNLDNRKEKILFQSDSNNQANRFQAKKCPPTNVDTNDKPQAMHSMPKNERVINLGSTATRSDSVLPTRDEVNPPLKDRVKSFKTSSEIQSNEKSRTASSVDQMEGIPTLKDRVKSFNTSLKTEPTPAPQAKDSHENLADVSAIRKRFDSSPSAGTAMVKKIVVTPKRSQPLAKKEASEELAGVSEIRKRFLNDAEPKIPLAPFGSSEYQILQKPKSLGTRLASVAEIPTIDEEPFEVGYDKEKTARPEVTEIQSDGKTIPDAHPVSLEKTTSDETVTVIEEKVEPEKSATINEEMEQAAEDCDKDISCASSEFEDDSKFHSVDVPVSITDTQLQDTSLEKEVSKPKASLLGMESYSLSFDVFSN